MATFDDLVTEVATKLDDLAPGVVLARGIDVPAQEADPLLGRVAVELGDVAIVPITKSSNVGGNPRPLMTWSQTIVCLVWSRAPDTSDPSKQQGADEDATVDLAMRLCAAFWIACTQGSFKGGAGRWRNDAKTVVHGAALELRLLLERPVTDEPLPIVNPVTPDNTGVMQPQT